MMYTEHVSEPWFTLISLGLKSVEGRLHKDRFKEYKKGDIVKWINSDFGPKRFVITCISGVDRFGTFQEYLALKKLKNCLPGVLDLEQGVAVYRKYYSPEKEKEYGIVAFTLQVLQYRLTCKDKVQYLTCPELRKIAGKVPRSADFAIKKGSAEWQVSDLKNTRSEGFRAESA